MKIQLFIFLLTSLMNRKLITILQAMEPILGDIYDGFVYGGVVWYEFIPELVAIINMYVLIGTSDVIWVFSIGLLLGGTLNNAINSFLRTGRWILTYISCIFEVLLMIKVSATYSLGHFNWYLSLRIAIIENYFSISGPKRRVIV